MQRTPRWPLCFKPNASGAGSLMRGVGLKNMSKRLLLPCAVVMAAVAGSCVAAEVELPARLLLTTTNAMVVPGAERLTHSGEGAIFGISNSLPAAVVFTKHEGLPLPGFVEVPKDGGWHTRFVSFGAFAQIQRFTLQPLSNYSFSVVVPADLVWRAACYGQMGTNTVVFRSGVFTKPNPQGGANGRQPIRAETNRTSSSAASRRSP